MILRIPLLLFFGMMPKALSFVINNKSLSASSAFPRKSIIISPSSSSASSLLMMSSKPPPIPTEEPLQPERVAALIEKSFVEACLQLANGFVDILKLFIVSTKAGYELKIPPQTLIQYIDQCPNRSAGRPLMKEEEELRNQWIHAVYLVLQHVQWKQITQPSSWSMDAKVHATFQPILDNLVKAKHEGKPLESEAILEKFNVKDVTERAIMAQTLRVIWITLEALQEEELAKPRSPRPKIPGAFDE